jgi:hypothetical protein
MGRSVIVRVLVSDYPILLAVVLSLLLIGRYNASTVRRMWNDRDALSRVLSRVAISALFVFSIWVTVFDNWRQLLGRLVKVMDAKDAWRSDPFLYGPPPDAVRALSWILLGVTVLGGAFLFARYARGGYFIPVILWPVALTMFFALNEFRMRFELIGPLSPRSVDFTDLFEAVTTSIWFICFYFVMAVLIACAYILLWSPTAIVAALLYRSTIGRQRIEEPEMFRTLRERLAARNTSPPGPLS